MSRACFFTSHRLPIGQEPLIDRVLEASCESPAGGLLYWLGRGMEGVAQGVVPPGDILIYLTETADVPHALPRQLVDEIIAFCERAQLAEMAR